MGETKPLGGTPGEMAAYIDGCEASEQWWAQRVAALQAENARLRTVTPAMLAAAWAVWKPRHPKLRLGPGPAFKEALEAAIKEATR